jgi:hypothetical protein
MAPSALQGPVESFRYKATKPLKTMGSELDTKNTSIDIIDIRHDAVEINLKEEILNSLRPQSGPKRLPTLLLYDERGLQLFEEVSLGAQLLGDS